MRELAYNRTMKRLAKARVGAHLNPLSFVQTARALVSVLPHAGFGNVLLLGQGTVVGGPATPVLPC